MNKFWKALVPFVLVLALLMGSVPAIAAESATTKAIAKVTIASSTYTGKQQTPKITVYDTDGNVVSSEYYSYKTYGSISAGKHKVVVTAKAPYTGKKTGYWYINKAKNPFTITVGKKTFTQNNEKNQTTWIKVSGVWGGSKVLGRWTTTTNNVYAYKGKVTVKKGFHGTATLSITSKEITNFKATKKSVTITVKEKK
jgi:hypothetical protein